MLPVKAYMRRQIFRLTWPVVLEMLGIMLASVLVTAMVGQLGAVSLAAVGLATIVQFSLAMIFAAAGTGAAAIVARAAGAGDWPEVRVVTGQAIMVSFLCGAGLAALGCLAAGPLFAFTGTDPAVAELATYLVRIMFLSTPFYLVMAVGNAVLRGLGQTRIPFLVTTLSNICAVLVSYILIFGKGLPAWGAHGAAWGTALSQLLGGLAVAAALAALHQTRLRPGQLFSFKRQVIGRILTVSLPAAGEQLAMQGGRIVFTFMLAGVGAVQFAAHQIAVQAESVSFMPGFGFSVAAATLTGLHLGRGLPHRAEQYVRLTNRIAVACMAVMGIIFFFFARPLTALFIDDPAVVAWGTLFVTISAFEQPTIAIAFVFGGALRGAGDTRWPMYVTTAGVWLFRLPLVYLFVIVWQFGIMAAWYITVADFLLRSIALSRRFASNKWQDIKIS